MMNNVSTGTAARTARSVLGILTLSLLAPPPADAFFGDFDFDFVPDAVEVYTGSDGTNAASVPESLWASAVGFTSPVACGDLLDNDGDGLVDGLDPGCMNSDGDLIFGLPLDDALEAGLGSSQFVPVSTPEHWFIDFIFGPLACFNVVDDDLDGTADFPADFTCHMDVDLDGLPATFGDTEGFFLPNSSGLFGTNDCTDGVDNDGDGLVDAVDPDCVDNDGDGFANTIDAEGPQGAGSSSGVGGGDDCYDGVDNDNDGTIDALDPDCGLCYGFVPTIVGAAGNDVLVGTGGADVIMGYQGDDRIVGADGDDFICAGPGIDKINGGDGNDIVSGSDGADILVGGRDNDTLYGDAGDDKVKGNAGFDTLFGGVGNDRLLCGPDNDVAVGGDGDDVIRGNSGDDFFLSGGNGNDDVRGSGGNDGIFGDAGFDTLRGNGGDDTIFGGDDDDNMSGGGGVDTCDGEGGGGDLLVGASCETVSNVP